MTWEYSGNPASSTKDKVRFYIGDTDVNNQQFQDEEIEFMLVDGITAENVAIIAVEQLIVRYAGLVDRTIGSLSISYSQKMSNYQALLKLLRKKFGIATYAYPYSGGVLVADKETRATDTSLVPPIFTRNQA